MPLRPPAGFISAFFDPLRNPNAPTIGTATGGDTTASVAFTAPANVGGSAISAYSALSTPGGVVATAVSSPISVTGLTNDTAYTFAVWAINSYGPSAFSGASNSVTPGVRVVYAGGYTGAVTNVIAYFSISSAGNAVDFGDLTTANRFLLSACSSSTRGIFAGGFNGASTYSNVIDYVTIATTGNATDYGDLSGVSTTGGTQYGMIYGSGCGNQTRGVFGRGKAGDSNPINVLSFLTIATTGTTSDFGDLLSVNTQGQAASGSSTRGVIMLGDATNTINYVTIDSAGNATDFGDLTETGNNQGNASASNSTRALFSLSPSNTINYITIATTGNATDFGDLTAPKSGVSASSSSTKAVFIGGYNLDLSAATNVIDTVTIASTGNATDFGDMTQATYGTAACSNGHGGL